jgi:molybdate transport system regulatory protein
MLNTHKQKFAFKVCVEYNNKPLIDYSGAQILQSIDKTNSISETAKSLHMSYRYVWNYLHSIQTLLGQPVVETFKGGKMGGGGAKLTSVGLNLLAEYHQVERYLSSVLSDSNVLENETMKLSARNQFKGKVVAVEEGVITGKVKVEIKMPVTITAVITKESIEELGIKVGDEVTAIIKSTEIMIAK